MTKKILVISEREADKEFSNLANDQREVVFGNPDEALMLLATENPDIILFYAEYAERLGTERKRVATAFEDVKRSAASSVKVIRLGFQPEQPGRNETYVELPVSRTDLEKLFSS